MAVQLLGGTFKKVDGFAIDDFESLPVGDITVIPLIRGTSGCVLDAGYFVPRQ